MKGCCWQTPRCPAEGAGLYPQTEAQTPVAEDPLPWQAKNAHKHTHIDFMFIPYAERLTS